jgi:DNA-binding IclR family transcriptional regulator
MSAPQMTVYEAVAALIVDRRPATVPAIAHMTQLPEGTVRRCLAHLTAAGRVVPKGDAYLLGPHDWGLEY